MAVSRLFRRRRRGGYRGSLRFPLIATLERLDTVATRASGAYDDVFKSFVPGREQDAIYKPPLTLHCQIEAGQQEAQVRSQMGDIPDSALTLVLLMEELELLDLIDEKGAPRIRKNDRLTRMANLDGTPYRIFDPPLYVTQVADAGLGLGGQRNLVTLSFEDRPQGISTG